MVSTFHGLETSKRGVLTQSIALHTVGHNISNASTTGYTRQRVNLTNAIPIYTPGFTRENTPGQIGSGVEYTDITRVRDSYLDIQYRRENADLGMWSIYSTTMNNIEKIINEPSDNGLSAVMDGFWDSLETLNRDPSLLSARVEFINKATNLADTFNYIGTSLTTLERDIERNIEIKLGEANSIIENIAHLNETIRKVEVLGDNANDYRDQRDLLMDQLSKIVDIQYTEDANGVVSVYAAGGVQVVNGTVSTALAAGDVPNITGGEIAGYKKSLEDIALVRNQLNALVNTLVNGEVQITMPNGYRTSQEMVAENNVTLSDGTTITAGNVIPQGSVITSSVTFKVNGFNGVHQLGYTANEPAQTGISFFTTTNGSGIFNLNNIQVNPAVVADTNLVAASGKYDLDGNGEMDTIIGNSDIALALTGLRDFRFNFPNNLTSLSVGTTDDYFRAFVSDLGSRAQIAETKNENYSNLVDGVEMRRQSTSGVQLDEELSDMIRFQHAYNASARNMTVVDEMLDRIINNMGLVGR